MSEFDKAFEHVIGLEGGYVNDPDDPGGETKYGICKRSYQSVDIAKLTIEDAKAIYKRDYWDMVKGDDLPEPLSMFVFDCAVNQGVPVAIRLLQKTLNVVQDGILGRVTLGAAARMTRHDMAEFLAYRQLRYTGTRHFDKFGFNWFRRVIIMAMDA